MATVSEWAFVKSVRGGHVDTVVQYLSQQQTAHAPHVVGDVSGSINTAVCECMSSAIRDQAPHEQDVPLVILRTLYPASQRIVPAVSTSVLDSLASATGEMMCQMAVYSELEAMEVVLCSWVFCEYMSHHHRMSVLASGWRCAGCEQTMELLLAHGFDPCCSPLSDNCLYKTMEWKIAKLCHHGATAIGDCDVIPAAMAIGCSVEYARELISMGADPQDSIRVAVQRARLDLLEMLVTEAPQADIDASIERSSTPLLQAFRTQQPVPGTAKVARVTMVETLLRLGADANGCWRDHETPLRAAALQRDSTLVYLLLEHGADPNAATGPAAGFTAAFASFPVWHRPPPPPPPPAPLFLFCRPKMTPTDAVCITLLLTHGADPNVQCQVDGRAPLHRLCFLHEHKLQKHHVQAITQLMRAGANVNLRDHKGATPLQLLLKSSPEVVQELRRLGLL